MIARWSGRAKMPQSMNTTFITAIIMAVPAFFIVRACYGPEETKRDKYAIGWAAFIFLLVAAFAGLGLV